MATHYLPLAPEDMSPRFRVDGTMAVRALVRELLAARELVTLYAGEDAERYRIARLLALEADAIAFDGLGGETAALAGAPYLTLVGTAGTIKAQLRLPSVSLRQGLDGARLVAPIPDEGWRVQRRNAFRIQPPAGDAAAVAVRRPEGGESLVELVDVSVGGLSVRWTDSGTPVPPLGTSWPHCRIEATGLAPIPCELRIVRARHADSGGPAIVSAEFRAMPEEVERRLQVYVMDVERRLRRLRQQAEAALTA